MINKTHFYYIVGILLTIIILQITVKFGADANLVNYISFALTLTSLILALVSIIYSFFSTSSFTQNISILNSASTKMSETASNLSEITERLNEKLDGIPELIRKVENKVDSTHEYLLTSYTSVQHQPDIQQQRLHFANEIVNYFMSQSSITGLYLLYALKISQESSKPVNLKDICEKVDIFEERYCFGYLIASYSFGLFEKKEESGYFIISNMHSVIVTDLKNKIEILADVDAKAEKNTFLKDQLRIIDSYFS